MPQNRNNSEPSSAPRAITSHLDRDAVIQSVVSRLNRRKRNSNNPPPVMTWGKALPIVIVAFLFDLMRIFFEWFWFLGPALGAIACTAGVDSAIGASVAGVAGKVVAAGCTAAAVALGTVFSESIVAFGVVMADAVALIGWLTIGFWVFSTNARLFKENGEDAMHVVLLYLSILISFIPIIGTAPTVGWITYRMFKYQIKIEKAALKQYEKEQAAQQSQDRNQNILEFQQANAMQQIQAENEEENNRLEFQQEQEEIPEEVREAA